MFKYHTMNYYQLLLPFCSLLILLSCNSVAQDKIPDAVKESFKEKYPGENDPDWRVDKNGYFESHFKKEKKHYRADFDSSGKWIETERNIEKKDLPKPIKQVLKAKYEDVKIYEIEEVTHHSKGKFYDVELKIDGHKKDIEFTEDGKIIN